MKNTALENPPPCLPHLACAAHIPRASGSEANNGPNPSQFPSADAAARQRKQAFPSLEGASGTHRHQHRRQRMSCWPSCSGAGELGGGATRGLQSWFGGIPRPRSIRELTPQKTPRGSMGRPSAGCWANSLLRPSIPCWSACLPLLARVCSASCAVCSSPFPALQPACQAGTQDWELLAPPPPIFLPSLLKHNRRLLCQPGLILHPLEGQLAMHPLLPGKPVRLSLDTATGTANPLGWPQRPSRLLVPGFLTPPRSSSPSATGCTPGSPASPLGPRCSHPQPLLSPS